MKMCLSLLVRFTGVVLILAGPLLLSAPARAQANAAQPSTDDLVQALTPGAAPKFRGLRLTTAPPTGAQPEKAPAVALNIPFKINSAELSPDAAEIVQRLGAALNADQLAHFRFRVEGHTDATGNDAYNMKLSQRRAESVRAELIRHYSVAPDRLEAVGLGKTQPIDPSDPNSALNRRVQIVNLGG
jgi:OOP family OmpA-OmpF porin